MSANAGLFGIGGTSWKEEVRLHDGKTIVVDRWHKRGGRHEFSSGPPIKEQGIAFTPPGTNRAVSWRDDYSDDVGSANFIPLALHVLNGTPYLIVEPYGCLAYNKWGRPNPSYVVFKHDGGAWQRIPLSELPAEFQTINLVIGTSNEEKNLDRLGTVSTAMIEKMNLGYPQAQYRVIVRDVIKDAQAGCPEMVYYKGGWVGPGEFGRRFMDTIRK